MVNALGGGMQADTLNRAIREDEELRSTTFWRIFEVPGTRRVNLAYLDRYGGEAGQGWGASIETLVHEGTLSGDRVAQACSATLARGFSPTESALVRAATLQSRLSAKDPAISRVGWRRQDAGLMRRNCRWSPPAGERKRGCRLAPSLGSLPVMRPGTSARTRRCRVLGPVPRRLAVGAETVGRLIAQQFPQWSHLSVTPVPTPGWDNFTFRLGDDMVVRLPSAAEYALAVEKEHRWLPELARHSPVPIPVPLGLGQPDAEYPFRWSIYGWPNGEAAERDAVTDPIGIAEDLASLASLHPTTSPAAHAASASRMSANAVGALRTARVSSSSARSSRRMITAAARLFRCDGHSLVPALDTVDDVAERARSRSAGRVAAWMDEGRFGDCLARPARAVLWQRQDVPHERVAVMWGDPAAPTASPLRPADGFDQGGTPA